jgi:hypothetical protein
MASMTGIEIGPEFYLLAGVRGRPGAESKLVAVRRFQASEWPADRRSLADALGTIRRSSRFPRRAAVVLWNTNNAIDDPRQQTPLDTLAAAGFDVASVVTPPEALGRLSTTVRRGERSEAVGWLSINTWGVAIAIVRDGELLFSRTLSWTYKPDLPTSKAQLLQRYLLIAHLAPELTHAFNTVRDVHATSVALVIACGNLPELRSLTLPLIEELGVEVETLDSTDGWLASGATQSADISELAPALRLAAAAAIHVHSNGRRNSALIPVSRFAAAATILGALAWAGYSYWHASPATQVSERSAPQPTPTGSAETVRRSAAPSPTVSSNPQPVATRGSDEPNRAVSSTAPSSTPAPPQQSRRVSSDTRTAAPPQASSTTAPANEPLPRIDTVLIDQDRRLAILDGAVVGVGDAIGSRVVVAIAREAVLLRERSGRIVRVRTRVGM